MNENMFNQVEFNGLQNIIVSSNTPDDGLDSSCCVWKLVDLPETADAWVTVEPETC